MATASVAPLDGFPDVEPVSRTVAIEPVQIEIVRRCDWRQKPCGACGRPKSNPAHRSAEKGGSCEFARKLGCANCGLPKAHPDHLGEPPSMNSGNHSMDKHAYQALKHDWQAALRSELDRSELPKGLAGVMVEGLIGFPDLRERDQGNVRWMVEKSLGDELVAGGWIRSDGFYPVVRYEFNGLQAVHSPGEAWTRLMIFGRVAV